MLNNWWALLGNRSIVYNLFSKIYGRLTTACWRTSDFTNACWTTSDFTNTRYETKKPKTCRRGQSYSQKNKRGSRGTKKALIEAQSIIAAKVDPPPDTPSADPPPEPTKNVLTTTQWLSVISIIVSLAGIYYKRKEIKSVFTKKTPVEFQPPSSPRAPCHHLLMLKEEWESWRWIEHFICFL